MSSQTRTRTKKIVIRVISLVLALMSCGAHYDLYYPQTTQMHEFGPDDVARLATAMYRLLLRKATACICSINLPALVLATLPQNRA